MARSAENHAAALAVATIDATGHLTVAVATAAADAARRPRDAAQHLIDSIDAVRRELSAHLKP